MKKALALVLAAALALSLAACAKKNVLPDESDSDVDLTPSITQEQLKEEVDFDEAEFGTAEDGEILIPGSGRIADGENDGAPLTQRSMLSPDEVWKGETASYSGTGNFTLPEAVQMSNGSLGELSIPKIGLTVNVYETDDEMEDMAHGVAHFKETSCWDGNVGLAGHNQGVNTYFGQIHTLTTGDEIILTTALGIRTYQVTTKVEISETDWSYLGRTDNNVITLITCVNHDLTKRLCVQAVEVA